MNNDSIVKHYLVSGRVQGVGFRRFVQTQARALGLHGAVRNLSDGRVEILARGLLAEMKALEIQLKTGPPASHVTDLVASELNSGHDKQNLVTPNFSMLADGEAPWSISYLKSSSLSR